jgi:hypothetical protein
MLRSETAGPPPGETLHKEAAREQREGDKRPERGHHRLAPLEPRVQVAAAEPLRQIEEEQRRAEDTEERSAPDGGEVQALIEQHLAAQERCGHRERGGKEDELAEMGRRVRLFGEQLAATTCP